MPKPALKRSDFTNDNEVRWCPGCGDYAVLSAIQRVLPEFGLPPEQHVFVSGIGCAGRFPYYMNTYGYHTIHGRAMAVATGLKAMHDDLCVWIITGDGDALSIGGNHFIHCLRRNVNVNVLLLNNQVYGLTKGQFSPTSTIGQITKTSPEGVEARPVNPIQLALASGASFVARAVDKDPAHLMEVVRQAYAHQGTSFIEVYQDCNIFNNGAFDEFALKANRAKNTLKLEHNKPMLFGENEGLSLNGDSLMRVSAEEAESHQHDTSDFMAAMRLSRLAFPDYPVPLGVYYQQERAMFSLFQGKSKKTERDLLKLYRNRSSWKQG